MVSLRSLSDSKSPQVPQDSSQYFSQFQQCLIWMFSTCPLISKSSSPCTNPLLTVPRAPITIGTTVTFMFHSFFQLPSKVQVLTFFSLSVLLGGHLGQESPQVGKIFFWLSLLLLLHIRVFHISVSWWYFTGYWETASLLKSPGLFSVFWPFSIMLLFGWSPLGRQLLNLPGPLMIL